jgi:hypothetical protein
MGNPRALIHICVSRSLAYQHPDVFYFKSTLQSHSLPSVTLLVMLQQYVQYMIDV